MAGQQIYFEDFSDSQFDPSTSSRNALYPAQPSAPSAQMGADSPREQRDVTPTDNPIRRLERQVEQQEEGREEQEKRKRNKEKERENGHDRERDRDRNRKKDRRSPEDSSRKKSRRDSRRDSESSRKNSRSHEDKRHHRDKTPEMKSRKQDKYSEDSRSHSRHRSRSERNSQTGKEHSDNGANVEGNENTNDYFNNKGSGDRNFHAKGWGKSKKSDFWEPGMPTTDESEPAASIRDQYREVYNYRDQNTVVYGEHDNFFETHTAQNQFNQNKEVDRSKRSPTPLQRLEKPTRRRPSLFWDVPPKGYEHITPLQYKAMQAAGQIPTLGTVVPSANTPTTPAVVTMVDLPPPIPMNFSSNFNSSFSSSSNNQSSVSNFQCASVGPGGSGCTQITAQLARQARRLYVGNIPFGITEELLLQFFNEKMHQSGLSSGPGNSITTVQVNHDKNFAFFEFRCVDECTNALVFDGTMLQGQNLRVRRPNGYASLLSIVESSKAGTTMPTQTFTNMSGVSYGQKDNPNKLFLGGIPCYLNDSQVQELLLAFGPLQAFNLVKDNLTGISKGYAFCEYMDHSVTDVAIQGLNGMQLGEKKIVVQRASVGAKNAIYAPASDLSQQLGIPSLAPGALLAHESRTKILCMLNMVIASELESDQEFEDIMEDVRDECGRYGPVISLEIPRPIQGVEVPGVGKIFVEFASVDDCSSAQMALAGRSFAGRTVVTSYFSEEKYRMKDFI